MKPSHTQLSLYGSNRFHNTIVETDERRLSVAEQTAKAQDDKVLEFMRTHQRAEGYTAFEISTRFPQMLLTSIRRALDNIAKDEYSPKGTVYRTGEKRDGGYGIKTIVWKYKPFQ